MTLAHVARPHTLHEVVGNETITGKTGILQRMLDRHSIQSCIFWGSPGSGKSTCAKILAETANFPFVYLNATTATTKDLRDAISHASPDAPTLIYLDEIQYFNKKQQQTLLSFVEDGSIILIAATTENPYHDVYKALLSRCIVLEFKPIPTDDIEARLNIVLDEYDLKHRLTSQTVSRIAQVASGDMRRALNLTELVTGAYTDHPITPEEAQTLFPQTNMGSFDVDGDQHYRYKAALQKSIRGSDPDAAVFWLNQLLEGGDIISPSRRMLVMASEDIGLADPFAIMLTLACVQAAERVGLPEARYPLTQAAIYLACAPKSNSIGIAHAKARQDINNGFGTIVPEHIASEHPKDYIYPHNFPNHWTPQQYLPDDLLGRRYYIPQENDFEQRRKAYWKSIKQPK